MFQGRMVQWSKSLAVEILSLEIRGFESPFVILFRSKFSESLHTSMDIRSSAPTFIIPFLDLIQEKYRHFVQSEPMRKSINIYIIKTIRSSWYCYVLLRTKSWDGNFGNSRLFGIAPFINSFLTDSTLSFELWRQNDLFNIWLPISRKLQRHIVNPAFR